MKRAAVWGGSGFIGSHLCARLVADGYEVTAYDRKMPEFGWQPASRYHICDLTDLATFALHYGAGRYHELYQLAAEMGGAGYVFTGSNDAAIMANSVLINVNAVHLASSMHVSKPKVFFASSACVYESRLTYGGKLINGACKETEGINPDSDYGLEKLFAEKLYDAYHRNHGLDIRIGRFHNIFGSFGTWKGGREKAPAALCRKIAELPDAGGEIEIWGSGQQTRSFLYVDEAVEAVIRLMHSDYKLPVNIGSSESVTIDDLAIMIADIAGIPHSDITVKHIPGPLGVDGRNSDNTLIEYVLGWKPTMRLIDGLHPTYQWIKQEVDKLPDAI
jgi:GDP-D-mannose 3',5'-epimerase